MAWLGMEKGLLLLLTGGGRGVAAVVLVVGLEEEGTEEGEGRRVTLLW
jgi:hypothetical protein